MKFKTLSTALLLAAGLAFTGCDDPSPSGPDIQDHSGHDHSDHSGHDHDAHDHSDHAEGMGEALKEKTDEVITDTKKVVEDVTDDTKNTVDDIKQNLTPKAELPADTDSLTLESLKPGTSLSAEQADGYLAKIKGLINDENFELANTWLTKLEGVNLPAGYGDKLTSLKSMLEKAQGASNALNNFGK